MEVSTPQKIGSQNLVVTYYHLKIHSLELTAKAPENRQFAPKRKRFLFQPSRLSGVNSLLVSGRVVTKGISW